MKESINKKEFIESVTGIVLKTIEGKINKSGAITIKITVKYNNIYFNLHRYGEDLNILIFKDGNVDACFKEACHSDKTIRVISYTDAINNKEASIEQFSTDIEMIISSFFFSDWHIFMDYLLNIYPSDEGSDWRQRICNFNKMWRHSNEEGE